MGDDEVLHVWGVESCRNHGNTSYLQFRLEMLQTSSNVDKLTCLNDRWIFRGIQKERCRQGGNINIAKQNSFNPDLY